MTRNDYALLWHELSHISRLGVLAGAMAQLGKRPRQELLNLDVVTDITAETFTSKGVALREWAESVEWLAEKADLRRGDLASYFRQRAAVLEGLELSTFLVALQRRDALVEFLRIRGIEHKVLGPEHREREGAVRFERDGEHWVAEYHPTAYFKQLVWA